MKRQQGKGKARQSKQSQRKVHSLTAIPTSYASTATVGGEGAQAQSQSQTQTHWRDRKHQQEQDQEQLEKELELRPEEEYKYDDDNAKGPSSSKRFPPTVVKPGDEVTEIVAEWTTNIKIGFGLQSDGDTVTVTVPGLLRLQKPNKFYVDASHRRYFPAAEDPVIATVTDRTSEAYKVHINGTQPALLPLLAFEGASKRNRPNLDIGAVVYARVVVADRYMEPEISCKVASGPTKDWVTGQSLYGELKGGHVQKCSVNLARTLLNPRCPVLETLGRAIPFELAVGVNGYFWVKAEKIQHVILVVNAILQSEYASEAEAVKLAKDILSQHS